MANVGKPPCDEGVIRSSRALAPCTRAQAPWVLAATIIGSAMVFIDGTITNVALPQIQERLGASAVDGQWIVTAYALFLAALILIGGSLGDHYGRRRIFLLGVGIFAVASVACALALTPGQLIAARAAQGVGGALLVPGSLAIIGASFREEDRGKAIGTWSGFTGITTAIGPVLGGYLVDNVSWRAAFLLNVPLAIAVILIAVRHVPESRDPDARRLDIPGAILATVGLGGIVYGLIESSNAGFGSVVVILSLLLGVFALVAFVVRERRTREPMLPLALFRSRNFSGANLLTLLLIIGPLVAATGFILFAIPGTDGSYWTTFFPAVVLLGLGMSFVIAPLTTTALNSVEGRHSGLASGVNNAVSRSAGLLAIPILGIFVFLTFSAALDARTASLDLSPQARQQLEAEKVDLGAAEVPEGVSGETAASVEGAVAESFVAGVPVALLGGARSS